MKSKQIFPTFAFAVPPYTTRYPRSLHSNPHLDPAVPLLMPQEGLHQTDILQHTAVPHGLNKLPLGLPVAGPDQVTGLIGPQCLCPLHHGKPHDLLYA